MKVIGQAGNEYLITLSANELSALTGASIVAPDRHPDYREGQCHAQVGDSFDIRAGWESVNNIRSAQERVTRFTAALRHIADDTDSLLRGLPLIIEDKEAPTHD